MNSRALWAIALTLVTLLLAACESDDTVPDATAAPTPTFEEFLEVAHEVAESATLSLDDFPPGWTSSERDDSDFDIELSEECDFLNSEFSPGAVSGAESDVFTGPEDQEVRSDVTVYASSGAAQYALNTFNEALGRCKEEITDAFQKIFIDSVTRTLRERQAPVAVTEGVGDLLKLTISDLSFSDLGESSKAFRIAMEIEVLEVEIVLDFVSIIQGEITGSFGYTFSGESNIDEELELARLFAEKLKTAEAKLPE